MTSAMPLMLVLAISGAGIIVLWLTETRKRSFRQRLAIFNGLFFDKDELKQLSLFSVPKPWHWDWQFFFTHVGAVVVGGAIAACFVAPPP